MPLQKVRLEPFDAGLHTQCLRDWLRRPHVLRWWGEYEPPFDDQSWFTRETHAVIVANGDPVGYLCWQRLPQDELAAAGLTDLPKDLVDIDILIGESSHIGRGIGPGALGLLLERLQADPSASMAGVATSISNEHAIRAFEKAGFRLFREFQDPEHGRCRYMVTEVGGVADTGL